METGFSCFKCQVQLGTDHIYEAVLRMAEPTFEHLRPNFPNPSSPTRTVLHLQTDETMAPPDAMLVEVPARPRLHLQKGAIMTKMLL